MDGKISFEFDVTARDSLRLEDLGNKIEKECALDVAIDRMGSEAGKKDGGLAIGIAITALDVSVIATLIQILSYWRSLSPKYSISIELAEGTFTIEDLNEKQLKEWISKIKKQKASSELKVLISKD